MKSAREIAHEVSDCQDGLMVGGVAIRGHSHECDRHTYAITRDRAARPVDVRTGLAGYEEIVRRWSREGWCVLCDHYQCTEDCPVSIAKRSIRAAIDEELRPGGLHGGDADPEQSHCSQCGQLFTRGACGPAR